MSKREVIDQTRQTSDAWACAWWVLHAPYNKCVNIYNPDIFVKSIYDSSVNLCEIKFL